MIYNMLTLSIQLLLIGFLVAILSYYVFPRKRSRYFVVELALSVVGAFLGTLFEAWIRANWDFVLGMHIVIQFAVPMFFSIVFIVFYRLANNHRD